MPALTLSSSVGSSLTPSPTLYINERVKELWATGETVYHLGFGESRFPVHAKLKQALADNANQSSYLPGPGIPELRQAAADYYAQKLGVHLSSGQVLVGPGSRFLDPEPHIVFEQRFTGYLSLVYGQQPPDGWAFVHDGPL